MSSLAEIYFNYNKAIQQAEKLENVARKLSKAADGNMENILGDVNRAWKSDSSPQYIKKGQKVQGDLRTTKGNLNNIAAAIRKIAKRVLEAELEAWRIANARKS